MKYINELNNIISKLLGADAPYTKLIINTLISIMIIKVIEKILIIIISKITKNNKIKFNFSKKLKLISALLLTIINLFIWEDFIVKFITLFSFISAAVAYSLRDIIINFFCGLYIKIKKPFVIEDRIKIDNHIGDVINIDNLGFEILEVDENSFQSTGTIIHIPNSKIFENSLKNYVKVFKYIWCEIEIKVPLDSDIKKAKGIMYKIVKNHEVLKKIPNKMMNQLNSTGEYRIYYNKLEPIIYTDIKDKYVSLKIRYLAHPKKNRVIKSEIMNEILRLYKNGEIELYQED